MFLIKCPYCGERDQADFSYAGEAHRKRPENPEALTDAEWADFVFMHANTKGLYAERWVHSAGCRKFFNMLRDTATDEILATCRIGEEPPKVTARALPTPCGELPGSGNDAVKILKEGQS